MQEKQEVLQPDPSLAQLRQLCSEYIAVPLGTGLNLEARDRCFLFFGPQGTGKSLMVQAIAHETNSLILDLSPDIVADRFTDRQNITKYMYMVFKVAKHFQPAIIWIDEIEHYFPGKKKPAKGKRGGPTVGRCLKFKRDLIAQVKKHLTPDDKVAIIACSNKPYLGNVREMSKFFYRSFYFPYPDYTSRALLFKHLVAKHGATLTENFPLSMFAHITEGYTPSSFVQAIQKVMTARRKKQLDMRPLTMEDFIGPLSQSYCCLAEEYAQFREFNDVVTGIKERRAKKEAPDGDKAKPNKKKN